jgi:hypothetical protein
MKASLTETYLAEQQEVLFVIKILETSRVKPGRLEF